MSGRSYEPAKQPRLFGHGRSLHAVLGDGKSKILSIFDILL